MIRRTPLLSGEVRRRQPRDRESRSDNVAPIFVGLSLNGTTANRRSTGNSSTITINEEGVVTFVGSFRDPGILTPRR